MIRVFAVGKKHQDWIEPGIARYSKRLRQPWNLDWQIIPHSRAEGALKRQEESERLMSRLDKLSNAFVILLDETGKQYTSTGLAQTLDDQLSVNRPLVIIIGGAYGVDDKLKNRADLVWSLGKLVYPHQLVRLILCEQIYRAQQIIAGSDYHHD